MLSFNELEFGWKVAFKNAWEAFINNTIPIGCAITNNDMIISSGRNMIYDNQNNVMPLYNNKLAHAEINALLSINKMD
jgi:tRNA(adenine34) deaminase